MKTFIGIHIGNSFLGTVEYRLKQQIVESLYLAAPKKVEIIRNLYSGQWQDFLIDYCSFHRDV